MASKTLRLRWDFSLFKSLAKSIYWLSHPAVINVHSRNWTLISVGAQLEENAYLLVSYNLLMMWQDGFLKSVTLVRWSIMNVTRLKRVTPCSVVQEVRGVSQPSSDESHYYAGAMTMCEVLIFIPVSAYPVTFAQKLVLGYRLFVMQELRPLLDWGTGIIVLIVTVLPTAETAHNSSVADVPDLCNVKIKGQPSFCGRHVSQQTSVCRNPHNSSHWYCHITWQMGYKHIVCQKFSCPCSFLTLNIPRGGGSSEDPRGWFFVILP